MRRVKGKSAQKEKNLEKVTLHYDGSSNGAAQKWNLKKEKSRFPDRKKRER